MTTATKSRKRPQKPAKDVYAQVTASIVAALETTDPGAWRQPWKAIGSGPRNIESKDFYKGVNAVSLGVTAFAKGYASPWWGTYKQWAAKGGQVRGGEKATTGIYYGSFNKTVENDAGEPEHQTFRVARAFSLFNVAQVDGVEAPSSDVAPLNEGEHHDAADAWIASTGARIEFGGDRACYYRALDLVRCPEWATFEHPEAYYSTLAHELTHWTGHEKRLNRTFGQRFGDAQYAAEELVAELGSAFCCARLGIESEPRQDHAEYLADWLTLLKSDDRAIFTAAAAAQRACDFLFKVDTTDAEEVTT